MKTLTGWFTVFTSRYGYLKSDTLAGIKKMINHAYGFDLDVFDEPTTVDYIKSNFK